MLVIRQQQFDAMRRAREEEFQRRLARMVSSARPEWCAQEGGGAIEIASWVHRQSLSYGFFLYEDVIRFMHFVLRFGRDFAERPETEWADRILHDSGLAGSWKLDRLETEMAGK